MKLLLCTFFLVNIFLFSCKPIQVKEIDPCIGGQDTTISINVNQDTSVQDFFEVISFIESKNEFSQYSLKNRDHRIDTTIGHKLLIRKLLCKEKGYKSPKKTWEYDSLFSISLLLFSYKPLLETKETYNVIYFTQLNFNSKSETNKVYEKLKEIGLYDPVNSPKDCNIIKGNNRIYLLRTLGDGTPAVTKKYVDLIQKEWLPQNNG
jgi:hypothetical protein